MVLNCLHSVLLPSLPPIMPTACLDRQPGDECFTHHHSLQILTYVCMYVRTYIGVPIFLTVYTHCYASRVTLSLNQLTNKIITVNLNRQLTTNMLYSRHLRDYLLRDNSSDMLYTVHMLAIILYTFC